jgi:hypothetical protein
MKIKFHIAKNFIDKKSICGIMIKNHNALWLECYPEQDQKKEMIELLNCYKQKNRCKRCEKSINK